MCLLVCEALVKLLLVLASSIYWILSHFAHSPSCYSGVFTYSLRKMSNYKWMPVRGIPALKFHHRKPRTISLRLTFIRILDSDFWVIQTNILLLRENNRYLAQSWLTQPIQPPILWILSLTTQYFFHPF